MQTTSGTYKRASKIALDGGELSSDMRTLLFFSEFLDDAARHRLRASFGYEERRVSERGTEGLDWPAPGGSSVRLMLVPGQCRDVDCDKPASGLHATDNGYMELCDDHAKRECPTVYPRD